MQNLLIIPALLISFFVGSIPTAYLMGRARGIDIRKFGSGNVGATNAFRVLGKSWGILCLVLDILKGFFPTILLGHSELFAPAWPQDAWLWALGLAAIAGHMFSPFLRFRGGKGVATSLGVILAIAPWPTLIVFLVAALIIWLTGFVSLGSMIGSALLPILIFAMGTLTTPRFHAWVSVLVTLGLAALIIWKHRGNIRRLRAGTEKRFYERARGAE